MSFTVSLYSFSTELVNLSRKSCNIPPLTTCPSKSILWCLHEYTCIRFLFVFTNNFFFEFSNLPQFLYIKNICLVLIHIEIAICICLVSCSISCSMKFSTLCSIISLCFFFWQLNCYSFLKLDIFVYKYVLQWLRGAGVVTSWLRGSWEEIPQD